AKAQACLTVHSHLVQFHAQLSARFADEKWNRETCVI
ncbi:MAG: hypothetical protein YPKNTGVA_002887, partial [Candidatus Fervidibacter sp.]